MVMVSVAGFALAASGPTSTTRLDAPAVSSRFQMSLSQASTAPERTTTASLVGAVDRKRQRWASTWLVPVPAVNVLSTSRQTSLPSTATS